MTGEEALRGSAGVLRHLAALARSRRNDGFLGFWQSEDVLRLSGP
jgi:hypothetical protein